MNIREKLSALGLWPKDNDFDAAIHNALDDLLARRSEDNGEECTCSTYRNPFCHASTHTN